MNAPIPDATIPRDVLALPISGAGLDGRTLGDELTRAGSDHLTLLVFLRHAG